MRTATVSDATMIDCFRSIGIEALSRIGYPLFVGRCSIRSVMRWLSMSLTFRDTTSLVRKPPITPFAA